jgi:phosphohistidine phosphatase
MKRLALLRHAKSSWDQSDLDDFQRPLNGRGRKAARRMGREMKQRGFAFDLVLASPATRVRETIEGVVEEYPGSDRNVRFEESIYLADSSTLIDLVRAFPDEIETALIIGHNPGLERLVLQLTRDSERRDRVAQGYPTAALAVIDVALDRWAMVEPGSGDLVELILPRELD